MFEKKNWEDRVTEYPTRRTLTKTDGSTELVTVARSEGSVSKEGDAFSAANMNDMESRIEAGFNDVGKWIGGCTIPSGSTTYTIENPAITAESIIDVYYAESSKSEVQDAGVSYTQAAGSLVLTFESALTEAVTVANVKVVTL